jgi:hypothetical protein
MLNVCFQIDGVNEVVTPQQLPVHGCMPGEG